MAKLGEGSYGNVFEFPDAGKGKCIKVLHSPMCDSQFHQMCFGSLLADFGALEGNRNWLKQHFVIPEQVYKLDGGKRGIVMDRHVMDLYQYVRINGRVLGQNFIDLRRALCDAVGYLNERGIFFCDISPGNVLAGSDGQWRLTDADLWRGARRAQVPSYCVCIRPPELLMGFVDFDVDMAACESWAVGVTLDFANRGNFAFGVSEDTDEMLQSIVDMHTGPLPSYLESVGRSRMGLADALDSPPQWSAYKALLSLWPERRQRLGRPDASVPWPVAPWNRIGGHTIDRALRQEYALMLWTHLTNHPNTAAICALAAISLVDLYLAKTPGAKSVMTNVLIAAVYLAQVHTQCYLNHFKDICVTMQRMHGHTPDMKILETAEALMEASFWQSPLGKHVWRDVGWDMVQDMIYRPAMLYNQFN